MSNSFPTSASGWKRSFSADETIQLGIELGQKFVKGSIIAFFGDVGAGKTTLIKGIVRGFTGKEIEIGSPTFTYLNIYDDKVFHFDLYRLNSIEEFVEMGFEEYFDVEGITCIEWSEKILSLLPPHTIKLYLEHKGLNERCYLISEMCAS